MPVIEFLKDRDYCLEFGAIGGVSINSASGSTFILEINTPTPCIDFIIGGGIKGDRGDKGDPGDISNYDPGDITIAFNNALI